MNIVRLSLPIVLLTAATLSCTRFAAAQPAQNQNPQRFGVELEYYRFTSAKMRDRFGNDSISISPTYSRGLTATKKGRVRFDFSVNYFKDGDNKLFMAPLGLGYRQALSEGKTRPYFGGSVNLVPNYLKVPDDNVDGKWHISAGGSVFAGVSFNRRFNLEARYFLLSKIKGYDPSGLQLAAGVRF